jgi:hypothetical protein
VVGLVGFGGLSCAYERIGISAGWMLAILAAALLGSLANIPVATLPTREASAECGGVCGCAHVDAAVKQRTSAVAEDGTARRARDRTPHLRVVWNRHWHSQGRAESRAGVSRHLAVDAVALDGMKATRTRSRSEPSDQLIRR